MIDNSKQEEGEEVITVGQRTNSQRSGKLCVRMEWDSMQNHNSKTFLNKNQVSRVCEKSKETR